MYFKRKSSVMFRNYGSFGYITDNRNFGYKQAKPSEDDIGDKIVSQSGAVFLSVLSEEPQTIDALSGRISTQFENADIETIKADAVNFYSLLEDDGFVVSGKTSPECNEKDSSFTYSKVESKYKKESCAPSKALEQSTQDFFDNFFNGAPLLTNLHIELTSRCNERCIHCYIPHEDKVGLIESDLFYDILEQCRQMNVLHITLSGGEPMLHSSFIDFLKKCNEFNFSVNILSNLTLLNQDIIKEMRKNHRLSVQVSLYSMDANIHDTITQVQGSFEKTKRAILELRENDIPLQISCPIMKQNVNSYNDVIAWGKKYNISVGSDYVIIARYNHTTQNLNARLSIEDVKEVIERRVASDPGYFEQMNNEAKYKKDMSPDDNICSVCHSSICISDNGNVYPCAGWQDYVVGNIAQTSLKEIWSNSTKVKYLRGLRKRDFQKCLSCSEREFCTMCMVRNANEHPLGDPLAVNEYFCSVAKISKSIFCESKCNLAYSQCQH